MALQAEWSCAFLSLTMTVQIHGRGGTELIHGLKKNTSTRRFQHVIGFIPQAIVFQTFFLSLSFVRVRSDFITLHLRPEFLERFRCQVQANWLMEIFMLASLLSDEQLMCNEFGVASK